MTIITPNLTTKQINKALEKGGEFVFESGEYALTECLVLHSNTDVVCGEDVSFIRAHKGRMLQLHVTPDTKGYSGTHDVSWRKGKFFAGTRNENANVISLFHGKNIAFRSVAIVGCRGMHSIEVNACKGVILAGCIIRDQTFKGKDTFREAIQIDFANYDGLKVKGAKPDSPCYDGTHCKDIHISKCYIRNCPNGIGTHTVSYNGKYHEDVRIINCDIDTFDNDIQLYGFKDCLIQSSSGNILIGKKKIAHLISGGKVDLIEPKGNKNISIVDKADKNTIIME